MNLKQFRVGIFRNSDKVIINIIALPVADELYTHSYGNRKVVWHQTENRSRLV